MTYRTPIGDRVVRGAEAEFLREALWWTVHYVTMVEGEDGEFEVEAFDRATYGQQLTGLLTVARALFDENVSPPPLTASIEACTAIIFETISEEVDCEIDEDGDDGREKKKIRQTIRATMLELGFDDVPEVDSTDGQQWRLCIDEISERFLFDLDFEDAELYVDLPPELAKEQYRRMHVDPNYFLHLLDDPQESLWPAMEKELRDLADEGARFT